MSNYKVVSSDSHVFEPAGLWTERIETKFKDRAPRIQRFEDGEWWVCDGNKVVGLGAGAQAGKRFEEPENMTLGDETENLRPGGWIPEEHIKDMDIDGVDVGIVYPTAGLLLYGVPDSELLTSIFRNYNDWVAEFCSALPKRIKGIAALNIDDVQEGVMELERCHKMGFVGAMITVYPLEERAYKSPEYEPLWAAAQDLGMPLSLHLNTPRSSPDRPFVSLDSADRAFFTNIDHWVRMSLSPDDLQWRIRALSEIAGRLDRDGTLLGSPLPGTASTTTTPRDPPSATRTCLRKTRCPATISTVMCSCHFRRMAWALGSATS